MRLIARKGYHQTTLRDIAAQAGVSVGLLYRYFPSKQAVLLRFYDELSLEFAVAAAQWPSGKWRERFLFALGASIHSLTPHRAALRALTPVLVGDPDDGVFSARTKFSRIRVQTIFEDAVSGASDTPRGPLAPALGRVLYLIHLGVLLWWLLDRSENQKATRRLMALIERLLPSAALVLRLPLIRNFILAVDEQFQEGLLGEPAAS